MTPSFSLVESRFSKNQRPTNDNEGIKSISVHSTSPPPLRLPFPLFLHRKYKLVSSASSVGGGESLQALYVLDAHFQS